MKPLSLIIEDAATLRGIVDFLAFPATIHEIEMTQHIGHDTAIRLCRKLQRAGILEHPIATRIILGVSQQVPQLEWELTDAYQRGEIQLNAEKLAGAI
jgi:hypothetical protein